ncbi:MAG: hypothetical protein HN849_33480 [Victivallales bacterium]|nr:hypothetical protein [Victivallales bacterium]
MSTKLARAFAMAQKMATSRSVGKSIQKCPLKRTGIIVLVIRMPDETMIEGATVDFAGPKAAKMTTGSSGIAKLDWTPAGTYTITVGLAKGLLNDYAPPPVQRPISVTLGSYRIILVPVKRLARPKIRVLRASDDKPVPDVEVKLSGTALCNLGTTTKTGLAQVGRKDRGLKPGPYRVSLKVPGKKPSEYGIEGSVDISLPAGCEDTFTFRIRPCWIEFIVTDQFNDRVSGVEYVLVYPEEKKTKKGQLKEGRVREDGPPGIYQLFLKYISYAAWDEIPLEIDKKVKLKAAVTGFDEGTAVTFDIYDSLDLRAGPVDTVTAKLGKKPHVEVEWTPTAEKLKNATSGALVFTVRAGKSQAVSPIGPVHVAHKITVQIDGKPATTNVVLHLTRDRIQASVTDGKWEAKVPWGQTLVSVEVPDYGGVPATMKTDTGSQTFPLPNTE